MTVITSIPAATLNGAAFQPVAQILSDGDLTAAEYGSITSTDDKNRILLAVSRDELAALVNDGVVPAADVANLAKTNSTFANTLAGLIGRGTITATSLAAILNASIAGGTAVTTEQAQAIINDLSTGQKKLNFASLSGLDAAHQMALLKLMSSDQLRAFGGNLSVADAKTLNTTIGNAQNSDGINAMLTNGVEGLSAGTNELNRLSAIRDNVMKGFSMQAGITQADVDAVNLDWAKAATGDSTLTRFNPGEIAEKMFNKLMTTWAELNGATRQPAETRDRVKLALSAIANSLGASSYRPGQSDIDRNNDRVQRVGSILVSITEAVSLYVDPNTRTTVSADAKGYWQKAQTSTADLLTNSFLKLSNWVDKLNEGYN